MKHLEAEAWEDFLDMAIGQAGLWAAKNIEPDKMPSEIMPTEPYSSVRTRAAQDSGAVVPMTSALRKSGTRSGLRATTTACPR